ncbi:MAG: DUF123 domain-containing protein [Halobaculum sp.]
MTGGTYTLLFAVPREIEVSVGALGTHLLPAGGYAYTGSALGSGGFSRIDRHRRVASGDHDVRHWHVDYLGGHDAVELVGDRRLDDRDAECEVASRLADSPIPGFGASDCDCPAHLARYESVEELRRSVEAVHDRVRAE